MTFFITSFFKTRELYQKFASLRLRNESHNFIEDARVGEVAADVGGEPDHREGLAGALRVPDHAARLGAEARLARAEGVVLVGAHHLLHAAVADHAVAEEEEERLLVEELRERRGVRQLRVGLLVVVLPVAPEAERRADRAVLEARRVALGVVRLLVRGDGELDGREEGRDQVALVREALADALLDRHGRALELDDGERDAVHVDDEVGARVAAGLRIDVADLLGEGEAVRERMREVEEHDVLLRPTGGGARLHAVHEQLVERGVALEEVGHLRKGQHALRADFADGLVDLHRRAARREEGAELVLEDRTVDGAVGAGGLPLRILPVAEIGVAEAGGVAEQADEAVLVEAFLFDGEV